MIMHALVAELFRYSMSVLTMFLYFVEIKMYFKSLYVLKIMSIFLKADQKGQHLV